MYEYAKCLAILVVPEVEANMLLHKGSKNVAMQQNHLQKHL